MKYLLILFVVLVSFTGESEYSFKLKEGETQMLYNTLQFSRQMILRSDAPVKDAIHAVQNIDSISRIISKQYQLQRKDTTKKK